MQSLFWALMVFAMRGLSAFLLLGVQFYLPTKYSVEEVGGYFLLFGLMTALSIVARMGLEQWGYRKICLGTNGAPWSSDRQVVSNVMVYTIVASVIISTLCMMTAGLLHQIFDVMLPTPFMSWWVLGVSVLGFTITMAGSELLKALKHDMLSLVLSGLVYPVLLFTLVIGGAAADDLMGLHSITMLAVGGVTLLILFTKGYLTLTPQFARPPMAQAGSLFVNAFAHRAMIQWAPIILAGFFLSEAALGSFSIVVRLAVIPSFFSIALISILFPKLLPAINPEDHLAKATKTIMKITAATSSVLFFGLLVGYGVLLSFFDPRVMEFAPILLVLAAGQVVYAFTNVLMYGLIFRNAERIVMKLSLALGVFVSLSFLLATMFDALFAGAVAFCLCQLVFLWLFSKQTGHSILKAHD